MQDPGLSQALRHWNALRQILAFEDRARTHLEALADALFGASERLIAYGSLAPGRVNHRLVSHLTGTWRAGWIRGTLQASGWGAGLGYPAYRWIPDGERVPAHLLHSPDLPGHWAALDEFEGPDYERILVPFYDETGLIAVGNAYAARGPFPRAS
jgi:gamma-glutamylcyclotransferase (GGCT)/AIG2-like uncharacterized protein YtfP